MCVLLGSVGFAQFGTPWYLGQKYRFAWKRIDQAAKRSGGGPLTPACDLEYGSGEGLL